MEKKGCLGAAIGTQLGTGTAIWYSVNFVPTKVDSPSDCSMGDGLGLIGFVMCNLIIGLIAGCFLGALADIFIFIKKK